MTTFKISPAAVRKQSHASRVAPALALAPVCLSLALNVFAGPADSRDSLGNPPRPNASVTSEKTLPPGTYYRVDESMRKELEATSLIEIHGNGRILIGKKITMDCWAGEQAGRIRITGEDVRIEVDSSRGDPATDACITNQDFARAKHVLKGKIKTLGEAGFLLCLESKWHGCSASADFVEYFKPKAQSSDASGQAPAFPSTSGPR